ncbi:MAG: dinuclear metal center YbgI/SA1388 family protein [Glaciecola sp.]|jgi:dinuclear metal center YbgI/SA1388 family protein
MNLFFYSNVNIPFLFQKSNLSVLEMFFVKRREFIALIDDLLLPNAINDYCPNGLQVEGADLITKVITGVTASQALIDEAIKRNADCILVHHGYFWKGESQPITGIKMRRIKSLLTHDINLLAYHLPIDIHPTLGNNAQLGHILNMSDVRSHPVLKPSGIVMFGELPVEIDAMGFQKQIAKALDRDVLHVSGISKKPIKRVAWCSGGGQGYIDDCVELSIDAFISGEISEQTTHSARELDIHYFAAGHHATERYGVKALGEYLKKECGINVEFVDIHNPA